MFFLVYLRTDPEVAYERIKTRNRSEEKNVTFEYIKHLHELHDKWLNVNQTDVPRNIPVSKLNIIVYFMYFSKNIYLNYGSLHVKSSN